MKEPSYWIMKSHRTITSMVIILFLLTTAFLANPVDATDDKFRVKVKVSGNDDPKNLVTSYINRELRSLNDVEVVAEDPEYEIWIVCVEVGRKGYFLSTVILIRVPDSMLQPGTKVRDESTRPDPKHSALSWAPDVSLKGASPGDLREVCRKIIAEFDVETLEGVRSIRKGFKEVIKDSQRK